jgi:hypothetical protein
MSRIFIALSILLVSVVSAPALECQASAQSGESHWAWRLIDGRKCWYKGAAGMDKSLLHWPDGDDAPDRTERPLDKPEMAKAQAMPQVQPIPPEVLKMLPIMPPQPTFEDRWRLH